MKIKTLFCTTLLLFIAAPLRAEVKLLPDTCIEKRSAICLLERVVDHRVAKGGSLHMRYFGPPGLNLSDDNRLVEAVVNAGDANLAKKLLPLAEDATSAKAVLLFATGENKAAQKQLIAWRKKDPEANGDIAVWALLRRGNLEEALKAAKQTVEWYPPPPESKMGMRTECGSYPAYPVAKLAQELALAKKYAQALEALALLKQRFVDPRTTDNYIRGSCNPTLARWAYARGIFDVGRIFVKDGKRDEASALLKDLVALYDAGKLLLDFYYFPDFADLAAFAVDIGDTETAAAIAARAEKDAEKPAYVRSTIFDEAAFTLAVTGAYGKALARVEKEEDADQQMNTLVNITSLAFASEAKEQAFDLVKEMEKRSGRRSEKLKNLYDLIFIAERYADLGMTDDSRRILKALLPLYTGNDRYMNSRLGVLHVRNRDWTALDAMLGEQRDFDYNSAEGDFLSAILVRLAKEGAWDDFDHVFNLYEPKFRALDKHKRFRISRELHETLIGLKQFDRYFTVMGKPANEKWTGWMSELVSAAFVGEDIPQDAFEKAWGAYAKACENHDKSSPEEKADECVFSLLRSIAQRSFLKYDHYPLQGLK